MLSSTAEPARRSASHGHAEARVIDAKIGQQLVADGTVSQIEYESCLRDPDLDSHRPGWRWVASRVIDERAWAQRIAALFGLVSADINDFTIDHGLIAQVPEDLAVRYESIPLCHAGDEIYIGITDPTALVAYDHLRDLLKLPLRLVVLPPSQVEKALERHYMTLDTGDLEHVATGELDEISQAEIQRLKDGGESGKIVELVDRMLAQAAAMGASDVHIEPFAATVRVRLRVDGLLRPGPTFPVVLGPWISTRIKVLARLDISERHKPQDGRVRIRMQGRDIDLRVSCLPVAHGEKIVIRLLGHQQIQKNLGDLGFDERNLEIFRRELLRPHGMVLVTGPTGSGKSTTLYAALRERTSDEINVVTVEDPIEYELAGINQVPVNPKRGVTFAGALRSILRQDPDVVLVGEIRDPETGKIAAEAAMTGHLLLSTLHTNDAASTVQRLAEMGVPRHLLAPSLNAVLAQRLMRLTCEACKVRYRASQSEVDGLAEGLVADDIRLVIGKGCDACDGTGYAGRIAIHECLVVDETLRRMIGEHASTEDIRDYAKRAGMAELRQSALERVFAGDSTVEEFHRLVNH